MAQTSRVFQGVFRMVLGCSSGRPAASRCWRAVGGLRFQKIGSCKVLGSSAAFLMLVRGMGRSCCPGGSWLAYYSCMDPPRCF